MMRKKPLNRPLRCSVHSPSVAVRWLPLVIPTSQAMAFAGGGPICSGRFHTCWIALFDELNCPLCGEGGLNCAPSSRRQHPSSGRPWEALTGSCNSGAMPSCRVWRMTRSRPNRTCRQGAVPLPSRSHPRLPTGCHHCWELKRPRDRLSASRLRHCCVSIDCATACPGLGWSFLFGPVETSPLSCVDSTREMFPQQPDDRTACCESHRPLQLCSR